MPTFKQNLKTVLQVGKTTLIKSLIRRYTKQTLSTPTGPLTVVTSKRRRLTFLECPADSLAGMIDIAKVVDIVLLMIDGKYGFEMETMEFLNVLSASGMPGNVFGILTKLDLFKKQDTLRAQKKRLKHRFWSELHQGAKLFYLSGVVNGRYPDREVLNLSRFLSVMKNPRPLIWRNSHPYCLADRFLDITPPVDMEANPKCDRTIALYGYLRGTNFPAQGARVHVPGLGDLNVADIEALPDPCPTPYMNIAMEKSTGKPGRKRLGEKQKVLFAPMSDVGGVLVDKDAVYIDVKTSTFDPNSEFNEDRGLGEQLVMGLQGDRKLLGRGEGGVRLFGDGSSLDGVNGQREEEDGTVSTRRPLMNPDALPEYGSGDSEVSSNQSGDEEGSSGADQNQNDMKNNRAYGFEAQEHKGPNGDVVFADSDSDIGSISDGDGEDESEEEYSSDEDDALRWKTDLAAKAEALHGRRRYGKIEDLGRLMYDLTLTPKEALKKWRGDDTQSELDASEQMDGDEDEFFKQKKEAADSEQAEDRMIPLYNYEELERKWQDPDNIEALRGRFSLAKPGTGDGDGGDEGSDGMEDNLDDEGDGEFEDLEAVGINGESTPDEKETDLDAEREKNAKKKEELKLRFEEEDRDGFANDKSNARRDDQKGDEGEFGEDDWYDAQKAKIQKQLDINRAEFQDMDEYSRVRVEGYKAGTYARLVLTDVPCEFSTNFNPRMPLIIGGLTPTEDRFGFVQVRIKRHRWHQKILKTNDPLILSLGWRRFQTIPIYSISDSRTRNRMLKYTPEHMHCFGTFYGPLIAPNTGFCAVQSFSNKTSGFRIAATGVVLNVDESVEIVKKLKLKGYPHKIYKNTAIIKDMFGSELEVAKFKAANLRTVSGIRGMVKGRAGAQFPDGYIRAGFEDKILMSDIVFLSTWRFVKPREFYNPVTNLLLPSKAPKAAGDPTGEHEGEGGDDEDPSTWTGMRLTGAVRAAASLPVPSNPASTYRPIERQERHFNPLRVPRKLAADLPFKSQISRMAPAKQQSYASRRAVVLGGEEKRARELMQMVMTVRNEKVAKRREAQEKRKVPYRKKVAENEEKRKEREKKESQEYWRKAGRKRSGNAEGGSGGGGKRRKT